MAVAAGIAAGALGAAGNLASSIYTTERNIDNSAYQAQLNRDFEKEMASTQYQRAVQDMKAAGLNPAAIGAGMSSNAAPTGSAAMGNYGHGADFSNVFNSAVSAAMAKDKNLTAKIVEQMKAETAEQVANIRAAGNLELQDRKSNSALDVAKEKGKQAQFLEMYKKGQGHRSYLSSEELRKLYSVNK